MKYIRTKDGRILDMSRYVYDKTAHWYRERIDIAEHFGLHHFCWKDEYDKIPDVFGKPLTEQLDKNECKFADTIEELCDVIVCNEKLFYPLTSNREGNKFNWEEIISCSHNVLCNADYKGKAEDLYFNIYGAIWTDKGLIYIAKMNDKGELELL